MFDQLSQLIETYDPQTNLWTASSVKLSHHHGGFEVIGSLGYVFDNRWLNVCDFSESQPKWERKASMNEERGYFCSVVLNGHIYALGSGGMTGKKRTCER